MADYKDTDFNINELGSFYSKDKTIFRVFVPNSNKVTLVLNDNPYDMHKNNNVFELEVEGDHELESYYFINSGVSFRDPFAYYCDKSSSYVLDTSKFISEVIKPKKCDDPIIYEVNVRDFSSSDSYNGKYRKKFLALAQDDLKINDYFKIGLSYIENIGVSHIQLMPVFSYDYDFADYNWGYNPLAYNYVHTDYVVENSNPYAYINELRKTINVIHSKDLRVTLDVVFNHFYRPQLFDLYKILPDDCFRMKQDGEFANGTMCGNEIKSENIFMRAYIVKMCQRYIELFDIDGLRFDLMGILDFDTMNAVYNKTRYLKSDFIVYGEGWNMGDVLDESLRASINNANKISNISMFNDFFRDNITRYINGDVNNRGEVKRCISGGNVLNYRQSINYVECHDNYTFYDRLRVNKPDEKTSNNIRKCKLGLLLTVLSKGMPFIHMGQEFIRSKNMIENTYNCSDVTNSIDWNSRILFNDVCDYLKGLIDIRRQYPLFKDDSDVSFRDYYDCLIYEIGKLKIIINPSQWDHTYEDDNEYEIIYDINGRNSGINKVINIPAFSGVILKNE